MGGSLGEGFSAFGGAGGAEVEVEGVGRRVSPSSIPALIETGALKNSLNEDCCDSPSGNGGGLGT